MVAKISWLHLLRPKEGGASRQVSPLNARLHGIVYKLYLLRTHEACQLAVVGWFCYTPALYSRKYTTYYTQNDNYNVRVIVTIDFDRVKQGIEFGLDDLPDDSDCEEEEVPEHFKETLESATGWVDLNDDPAPPSLSLQNIHQFFVLWPVER